MIAVCNIVHTAIHGTNLVHNDLKPYNILKRVNNLLEDEFTIIDFEHTCKVKLTSSGFTYEYCAPERIGLHRNQSSFYASDVYSLGMIFVRKVSNYL